MTTALVPVDTTLPFSNTYFGRFYREVAIRYAREQATTMHGAAVWSVFPIDAMLLDGLWPLLLAAAEKMGMRMRVPADVDVVIERVNRVLTAGLMVRYGSPERAADAFHVLLRQISLAIELGLRPGMKLSSAAWKALRAGRTDLARQELKHPVVQPVPARASLWQDPVSQFFAECMKSAREHAEMLDREQRKLRERVRVRVEGTLSGVTLAYCEVDAGWGLLTVPSEDLRLSMETFLEGESMLAAERVRIETARRLPIDYVALAKVVNLGEVDDVAAAWLRTQLLLAAINLPGRQHLESLEYLEAVRAAKAVAPDKLVERALAQIHAMGFPSDRELVDELRQRLNGSVRWVGKRPEELSIGLEREFMIRLDVEGIVITPDEAYDAAVGEDPRFKLGATDLTAEEVVRLRDQAASFVRWDTLEAAEIGRMIKAGVLTTAHLIDGVACMPVGPDREDAVRLLWRRELTTAQRKEMFERELMSVTLSAVVKYPELVPRAKLDALVRSIFNDRFAKGYNQTYADKLLGQTAKAVGYASPELIRKFVDDPRFRPFMAFLVNALIYASDIGTDRDDFARLKRKFDEETWQLLVLGGLVERRRDERRTTMESGRAPEHVVLTWQQVATLEDDGDHMDLVDLLGDDRAVVDAMERHSEESVLRWLHAGRQNLESMVAKWRDARDRYEATYPFRD